jgi:hypothetical protein
MIAAKRVWRLPFDLRPRWPGPCREDPTMATFSSAATAYQRRTPEQTVLYRVVAEHLETS